MLRRLSYSSRTNNKVRFLSSSSKVFATCLEAVQVIKDGSSIGFGGFGLCGIPENLIAALRVAGPKNLDCISNDAGVGDFGLGELLITKQVKSVTGSYVGEHKTFLGLWSSGEVELNLVPQGTLAEKLRSGGAGIPAFYTPAGVGTYVQSGKLSIKFDRDGKVIETSKKKESRVFNGKEYVLEESITTDFALIRAWKGDALGNLVFRGTARNFNPECAKAARFTIAEVEELVEVGALGPDEIHLPGIYVDRIVQGTTYSRRIERLMFTLPKTAEQLAEEAEESAEIAAAKAEHEVEVAAAAAAAASRGGGGGGSAHEIVTQEEAHHPRFHKHATRHRNHDVRNDIARRAGLELKDGMHVNIGIGIPTLVSNYIPAGVHMELHSENGLMGTGPYPQPGHADADIINAGKETVTYLPGSSTFSSSDSFAMIRGGHIDITILGALQVSAKGDLANWIIPGVSVKGMGGAMDLVAACPKVVITTTHLTEHGKFKILEDCTLPLTGKQVVDMIITELAVFRVNKGVGLVLMEIADGITVEELRLKTGAHFEVSPTLCEIRQY